MGFFSKNKEITSKDFEVLAKMFEGYRKISIERLCRTSEDHNPWPTKELRREAADYYCGKDELSYLLAAFYVHYPLKGPVPVGDLAKYLRVTNDQGNISPIEESLKDSVEALTVSLEDIPMYLFKDSKYLTDAGVPGVCCNPPNSTILAKWRLEIGK